MSKLKKNKWALVWLLVAFFLVGCICFAQQAFFDIPSQLEAAEKEVKMQPKDKIFIAGEPEEGNSEIGKVLVKKTVTPVVGTANKWKVTIHLESQDDSDGNTVQNIAVVENITEGFTVEGGTNQEDATCGDITLDFKGQEILRWKMETLLSEESSPSVPSDGKRSAEMSYVVEATAKVAKNIDQNGETNAFDLTTVSYTDLLGNSQQEDVLNEKVSPVVLKIQKEVLDENNHQIIDSARKFKIDIDGNRVPISSNSQREIVRPWVADKVYEIKELLDDPDEYETTIETNGNKIKGTTYDLQFQTPITNQTIKIINKKIKNDNGELEPGEVKVNKKATQVPGTVNQWDVTLRVDAMDEFPPPTSDVVLVFDTSGSMADAGRMTKAKEAAKLFVNTLLQEGYQNKVALVSFSEDANINKISDGPGRSVIFATPKQKDELIKVIDGLKPKGGTHTQSAIKAARDVLSNEEDGKDLPAINRQIIFISDGAATYSYGLKSPYNSIKKAEFDPDFHLKFSGQKNKDYYFAPKDVPERYIDYSNRVGDGVVHFLPVLRSSAQYLPGFEYFNDSKRLFVFTPIYAAINESKFAKLQRMKNGDSLLTNFTSVAVDFGTPTGAEKYGLDSLEEIASSADDFFSVKSDDISGVLNKIAEDIILSAKEASFKDPIGKGFKIIGTPKATNGSVTVDDGQTIDWEIGNVSTVLDSDGKTKHRYEEITYRVEATPDVLKEMDKDGTAPTNGKTVLSYVGTDNHNEQLEAIVPKVKPMIISVQKKLFDAYGNEVTSSSEPFHFQINHGSLVDKTFDLKPGSTTKIVQPWEVGTTYSVSELLTPSQQSEYETSVVTNGAEMQGATTYFKIDSADDIKDQTLLFKNKVYSKKKSLYIRQCVINTNNELVIPSKGYYSATFGDDKQLPLLSESTTKDTSEEVNSKIFTKYQLKLESATKNKLNIKDYIPEYYKLFGSVVTTDSNNLNMLHLSSNPAINKSDKIQLDYGENDENWVTIFIEPSLKKIDGGSDTPVEPPQPYSWSYKTNIFGK